MIVYLHIVYGSLLVGPSLVFVYEMKKNAKYRYKLAIRDVANQFEDKFNDEMLDSYMNKDFNNFWHCWKKRTRNKSPKLSNIDGYTKDVDIANSFANHFSTVCDKVEYSLPNAVGSNEMHNSYETLKWFFYS